MLFYRISKNNARPNYLDIKVTIFYSVCTIDCGHTKGGITMCSAEETAETADHNLPDVAPVHKSILSDGTVREFEEFPQSVSPDKKPMNG
jgi:hypothetical protein